MWLECNNLEWAEWEMRWERVKVVFIFRAWETVEEFPVDLGHNGICIWKRLYNSNIENQFKPGLSDWQTIAEVQLRDNYGSYSIGDDVFW